MSSEIHQQPISLDLRAATQLGEREWELPTWNSFWGRAIYPFLVSNRQRHLFPLGTAFGFSSLNHVMTARHNVEDGLRKHQPDVNKFIRKGLKAVRNRGELRHTHFVVLSQGPHPNTGISLELRSFASIHAAPPTDLLVGNIITDRETAVPAIEPTISFAPPRIGEKVLCVGYADISVPEAGLPVDEIDAGNSDFYELYSHRFLVYEARVKNIFLKGLSKGFVSGPCFTIDTDVPHGLSGGPIFRRDSGAVCGVVYSGASNFFDSPTTVGALLYPIFLLRLNFGTVSDDGRFSFTVKDTPVADLVERQAIRTDGAEESRLHFTPEGAKVRIGATFHEDDLEFIFDNLNSFQENSPSQLIEERE